MTTTKTTGMNVSLTPEIEGFVKSLVESGRYNSQSEVVRSALRLLEDQERLREMKFEALQAEIQKGVEDLEKGESSQWDVEDVISRGKERLKQRRESN